MQNLIRTEWLKIKKYRLFWWLAAIVMLTYPGINSFFYYVIYHEFLNESGDASAMLKMLIGNPFTYPEVWHTVAYASSVFVFIPAIVIIMFITNEYTYKTHRQNIIDGWSRKDFMTAKMIDVFIITLLCTIIYVITSLVIGSLNIDDSTGNIWEGSKYIWLFFLQTFSQLSIAFLIAFLVRKAFIALGIFLFYKIILEHILVALATWKLNDVGRFLPFEVSNRIIPLPAFFGRFNAESYEANLAAVNYHVIYTFILVALTWGVCYRLNERRDL